MCVPPARRSPLQRRSPSMAQPQARNRIDLAFDALQRADWTTAARLADTAMRDAEERDQNGEAALARFLLGTALVGPEDCGEAALAEARTHLETALPELRRMDEN